MHRFAEQRGVMAAIVQAHNLQRIHAGTFQQVEGGRCLAEAPQLRQRDAQYPAQQYAVDRIVGHHQQGVFLPQPGAGARKSSFGFRVFSRARFSVRASASMTAPLSSSTRTMRSSAQTTFVTAAIETPFSSQSAQSASMLCLILDKSAVMRG